MLSTPGCNGRETAIGTRSVHDREHMKNIEELSSRMSENYRSILRDGSFRIGPAQKALNLYLKYQWARGLIGATATLPHRLDRPLARSGDHPLAAIVEFAKPSPGRQWTTSATTNT